ncbi:centrosomal protein of 95 kDa [Tachyglossus aculeatus]|uniref:centrosomal protein of 95 kDa n=1 Tax=Tachyglossus aculeatus TaxID=9261 RepID=UPI0018F2BD6F|nr:centrosomal protein of 95 kDa [Tachyglossus aculeatus]
MAARDSDWITVANTLLLKCHSHRRIQKLSECDANIFISLYHSILGEPVPDLITLPTCQEDDAHNVQAVIDSLALDYLQVSLSHIIGENIVKGDQESIKNLLEIFDGLLEYLTEHISEASSQNGDKPGRQSREVIDSVLLEDKPNEPTLAQRQPSCAGSSQSSDIFVPSWDIEGSESTGELIKLGDTAHTFSLRREGGHQTAGMKGEKAVNLQRPSAQEPALKPSSPSLTCSDRRMYVKETAPSGTLMASAKGLGEPIRPAIPLQPPYHPPASRLPYPVGRDHWSSDEQVAELPAGEEGTKSSVFSEPAGHWTERIPAPRLRSSFASARDIPESEEASVLVVEDDQRDSLEVLDRAGRFPTTSCISEEAPAAPRQVVSPSQIPDSRARRMPLEESHSESRATVSLTDGSASCRRARNHLSKQELGAMSEKLSCQLNKINLMLKSALGEQIQEEEPQDYDKLSQHSDSVMEYCRKKSQPGILLGRRQPIRPRSLSPSPSPPQKPVWAEAEDALRKDRRFLSRKAHQHTQKESEQFRIKAKVLTEAYEEELRGHRTQESTEPSLLNEEEEEEEDKEEEDKEEETEQEYKENISKGPSKSCLLEKVCSRKTAPRHPRHSLWIPRVGSGKPKKAASMKIRENDLLPLLMEELPYLQVSRQTLGRLWKKQVAQIEQLTAAVSGEDRSKIKLQREVEDALKKHDLLAEIISKEHEHNKRLQEFKERIYRQRLAQTKMKEKRQQIARAKKYYEEYRVQLRAKMMRARTREERIFKNVFEEGLEIQKQRLRELRAYSREKRDEQKRQHQNELESMENYYKDQFSMLAEAISQERQEINLREKAQTKTLHKIKREFRSKMEKEIQQLQTLITENDDDTFFRELEAERLKARLQMASFQYRTSHF